MAKLRLGSLTLRIETGRYSVPRLKESDRKCLACDQNEVENETHFMFQCSCYDNLRVKWFSEMTLPANFITLTTEEKLKCVLNESINVKPTARFISTAWNHRNLHLNTQ